MKSAWINTLRVFILLLIITLYSLSYSSKLFAANITLTNESLTLSAATPSTSVTHTFQFTPSNTSSSVATIKLQYATTATGSTVPSGLSMSATPTVTVTTNGSGIANTATYASGLVTITFNTPQALSSLGPTIVTISSVTNPSGAGTPFYVQITCATNVPATTDYGVVVTQANADVSVSGIMDPSVVFSISGLTAANATGATTGGMNNATVDTTATAIGFGHFNLNGAGNNVAAQSITTTTNAANGYSVYLQENQALTSGSRTISNVSSNTTWVNGTTTGFGVNVRNGTNGDTSSSFNANTKFQPIPISANTLSLATFNGPTNVSGDSEYVIFQVGVSAQQAAGTYSNSLDYVVVPSY